MKYTKEAQHLNNAGIDHDSFRGKKPGRRSSNIARGLLIALVLLLSACESPQPLATPSPQNTPAIRATQPPSTLSPSPQFTQTSLPSLTPSFTPTPLPPTITPTPDPYAGLSIPDLVMRSYGGGSLQIEDTLAVNSYFTRNLVMYPSDGLSIYGFMNVPITERPGSSADSGQNGPPYPVIIAVHGYIDPAIYKTLDYTTRYADALARAGFIVLHPNLRDYPPSDSGSNLFRVGMAVDVLNLIAIVKEQAGKPGPLEMADPGSIGLWGHSMGGGITTRVITISPDVKAAVLYGAMSGDELKNYERIFSYFSPGTRGLEELAAPPDVFSSVSPINYLNRIQAAVSINHGENDPDVPPAWSQDLYLRLKDLGKTVEYYTYPNQGHTFHGEGDVLFMQRMIDFFDRYLKDQFN
jgi:dienelactone hydrolase